MRACIQGGFDLEDLIFGRNAVAELLKSGHSVNRILIAQGSRDGSIQKIFALAKTAGVVVEFVSRDKLDKLCGGRHQGVAAYAAAADYSTVEEILELAEDEPPFIILLDELEDPQNFGAILRTAEAVGVHGVIIPKRRSVQLNATVFKTSAGAAQYVKVAQVTNVAQTLKQLREVGLKVVGSDMNAAIDFKQADLTGGIVLIIGSEGKGMRRLTRESCDELIRIPMVGKINSLNASVASALLMYEIFFQRRYSQ
ncbi:MAG: 23S rRNA (guanosine(2251)-2'-O)-methyltransferase RlmB [Selenomonadaceae bacterium]|nr:23S rRNA (guanosine(2251)-2'-O)-methyltransferase RlmB [Selenomonadaceae bacterium]